MVGLAGIAPAQGYDPAPLPGVTHRFLVLVLDDAVFTLYYV
ncbi:hypothetical protein KIS4809_3145 [Bacillus sp. ZZV12-4809]|nr:hypothetical protein KIS4809_3145 [Bacillus sp. ZZV12-4809]